MVYAGRFPLYMEPALDTRVRSIQIEPAGSLDLGAEGGRLSHDPSNDERPTCCGVGRSGM